MLDGAAVKPGSIVVDLGAGSGLVGVAAAARGATVFFTDVSPALLDDCRRNVAAVSPTQPRYFIETSADDLSPLDDEIADAVTARPVLIYVADRHRVLDESFRVLRPGGRLSVLEPLNSFWGTPRSGDFCGYDLSAVASLSHWQRGVQASRQWT
ncbi:MAG TPA: class I SAM-dependent methyltransferase [Gaiellaceae bacterium]|nr:class I SAM-dependent methyltransferase [Gaiellaceae bacterium]